MTLFSFRSFLAIRALVALALLASLYSFIRDIIQLIGGVNAEPKRRRATVANCYAFPFTCIRVLLSLIVADTPYLTTVIENAYGSVYWIHTGTVKHFSQYTTVRQGPPPAFLALIQ